MIHTSPSAKAKVTLPTPLARLSQSEGDVDSPLGDVLQQECGSCVPATPMLFQVVARSSARRSTPIASLELETVSNPVDWPSCPQAQINLDRMPMQSQRERQQARCGQLSLSKKRPRHPQLSDVPKDAMLAEMGVLHCFWRCDSTCVGPLQWIAQPLTFARRCS